MRTFGGLSLVANGVADSRQLTQRRQLALLAVLAALGGSASRDTLTALLWPERDTDGARHSLRQALYRLRQDLSEPDLYSGGSEIRLNSEIVTSDVQSFLEAIERGDLGRAAKTYRGAFLAGFFLPRTPDFERWVESTRARLDQQFVRAVETLAVRSTAAGDHLGAARWWQDLAQHDPLSSRIALSLTKALVAGGDSGRAILHARAYERVAREELGTGIPDDLANLLATLVATRASTSFTPATAGSSSGGDAAPDRDSSQEPLGEPTIERTTELGSRRLAAPRIAPARRRLKFTALAILGAIVALGAVKLATARNPSAIVPGRVIIYPFGLDAGNQALIAEGIADLLAPAIDGVAGLHPLDGRGLLLGRRTAPTSVDPGAALREARANSADMVVLGRVTEIGVAVRISAQLYDQAHGARSISTATVEGRADSALGLINRLAASLFAQRVGGVNADVIRQATRGTTSPEALRAFLEGESAFRDMRYAEAADAFARAVAADSLFALGYYRLSVADDWASRGTAAGLAAKRAFSLRSRLSAHDSLRVEALRAWRASNYDAAEMLYSRLVDAYPLDMEASYQLGEVRFHGNSIRGRSPSEAAALFNRVLNSNPGNREVLVHLQLLAALEGRGDAVDSLTVRLLKLSPDSGALQERAIRAFATGHKDEQDSVLAAIGSRDELSVYNIAWRVACFTHNLQGAIRIASLLVLPTRPDGMRALGFGILATLHLAAGQRRTALSDIQRASPLLPEWALEMRAWILTWPGGYEPPSVRLRVRDSLLLTTTQHDRPMSAWIPNYIEPVQHETHSVMLAAMLSASVGDTVSVAKAAKRLSQLGATTGLTWTDHYQDLALSINDGLAHRFADALDRLRGDESMPWFGMIGARFYRGEWAAALGRFDEAVRLYRSFDALDIESLAYSAVGHFRAAQIAERIGNTAQAVQDYDRVIELWGESDVDLKGILDASRAARIRLSRQLHP